MKIFVTAIGTDCGKTVVSSILTEALEADYWKPIQAGRPRDTEMVQSLISNSKSRFFEESYLLESPESPHSAAKKEGININLDQISLPETNNHLVVEGAGGLLVPLNDHDFVIDIAEKFRLPVLLVANLYLGSINHTLLSVQEIKRRKLDVAGIIFNGEANPQAEEIILRHSGFRLLLKLKKENRMTPSIVKLYSKELRLKLNV